MRPAIFVAALAATLTASLLAAAVPAPGAEATATATVRLTRAEYAEGEPIGVTLTITNTSRSETRLPFNGYPQFFLIHQWSALRLDADPATLTARPDELMGYSGPLGFGETPLRPGASWHATTFLQESFKPPGVGEYEVRYHVRMSLPQGHTHDPLALIDPQEPDDDPFVSAEGTHRVKVRPAAPGEIKALLDG